MAFCNSHLNKAGLLNTLNLVEDIEEAQFEQFLHGVGGSALLFNVLDCGAGKESADNKLRGEFWSVSLVQADVQNGLQNVCAFMLACLNAARSCLLVVMTLFMRAV